MGGRPRLPLAISRLRASRIDALQLAEVPLSRIRSAPPPLDPPAARAGSGSTTPDRTPPPRTALHARLTGDLPDEGGFLDLWAPIPGASSYQAASYSVSGRALVRVLDLLVAHRATVPTFQALLVFDQRGLDLHAWTVLEEHLRAHPGLTIVALVKSSVLFHAKVAASATQGGERNRVVIGSANLTVSGLELNREAVVEVQDDIGIWQTLILKLCAAGERADATVVTTPEKCRAAREAALAEGVLSGRWGLWRDEGESAAGDPGALAMLGPGWRALCELVEGGQVLLPPAELEPLHLNLSLASYKTLGVLAELEDDEIAEGISWGGRQGSLSISMLPRDVQQVCKEANRKRGDVIRQFTGDAAGRRWLPNDWASAFQQRWSEQRFDPMTMKGRVDAYVQGLEARIQGPGFRAALAPLVRVRPAKLWRWKDEKGNEKDARAKLYYRMNIDPDHEAVVASRLTGEVTPELTELVTEGLLNHIWNSVSGRLNPDYPLLRLRTLALGPTLRPFRAGDPVELALIVLGWTLRAASTELRVGEEARPTGGVAKRVHQHLFGETRREDARKIYSRCLEWQEEIAARSAAKGQEAELVGTLRECGEALVGWLEGLRWGEGSSES